MSNIRILSHSYIRFKDRQEAGRLLAKELADYKGQQVVALGIPRGGIVVAYELALSLDAELDLVLAHKLGTPGHTELAMGSVSEDGKVFLNEDVVSQLGISRAQIEAEKLRQLTEINRRASVFRKVHLRISLKDKIAIVTDDGVATGATTLAALWAVRLEKPKKLIVALPVGPEDTIKRLAESVDEMICLATPPYFSAVGQFYSQFIPVEDEEVIEILKKASNKKK